ncbi:MAG: MFS transporter [Gammaproteobacteria bacterium]|nr:MFS transporter [Gammaproteobacteria bacterium]
MGLVILICVAQVLVQIGAFFWPALLPVMIPLWGLSNSEAGWITAIFYGAYMLSVPVLVTLTDRFDPKSIYLFGVGTTIIGHLAFGIYAEGFWSAIIARALTGIGWAGTYMTGLKLLADLVDARTMSRATAGHAASIGASGALSFATGDFIASHAGWEAAFIVASMSATIALVSVSLVVPSRNIAKNSLLNSKNLYDFRPVLKNRSSMAYSIAYAIHTLEMSAVRGWAIAFLSYVAISTGEVNNLLSPAIVATVLGLIGTVASVIGNEIAIQFGRRRLIQAAIAISIVLGASIGFIGSLSYSIAMILLVIYGIIIWLDSSSLTAGSAGTADPARRGQTLAVHSMMGYAGGFIGPLVIGCTLDLLGGMSQKGWGFAFMMVAVLNTAALVIFWRLRPRELEGDKGL